MNQVLKSFQELPKMPTTYIGRRLKKELGGYGRYISADIGRLLGLSDSVASHWMRNGNGISQLMVKQLAFVLGLSPDDLADTGKYDMPKSETYPFDKTEFAREIIELSPTLKNKEFMVDVVGRARAHLETITPAPVPEPAAPVPPKPSAGFRETVQSILETAEKFRAKNNIEWIVKADGSLGAKRTVVEEF